MGYFKGYFKGAKTFLTPKLFYCFNKDMWRKPREISQIVKKSAKVYHRATAGSTENLHVFQVRLKTEKSLFTSSLFNLSIYYLSPSNPSLSEPSVSSSWSS
jgi:hypothetical protein